MFHYGKRPINNIKRDISNIEFLKKSIVSYPEPISDLPIQINDVTYQDDFEISLLRFIHIIFKNNNKIDLNKLKNLIGESYPSNDLYIFLAKNNNINEYISTRQRLEWCNLLNEKFYFHYRFQNKYKLSPIISNIFNFFQIYFPLLNLTREMDTQMKIDRLLNFLVKLELVLYSA